MAIVPDRSGNSPIPGVDQSLDNDKFLIVPSDTVRLPAPIDAIMAGGAGTIRVRNPDGSTTDMTVAVGGPYFVGQPTYVHATGTTATNLVGMVSKELR